MPFNQIATAVTIISSLNGWQAVSLTNMATSAQSLIASGSKVEIGGAFFGATENITPNASSWTVVGTGSVAYITVTPSGSAGSQVLSAAYTSTAPTWRTDYQGWYASAGSLVRYIGGVTKTSATQYDDAFTLEAAQVRKSFNGMTLVASTFVGAVTGNVTGNVTGGIVEGGSSAVLRPRRIPIGTWNMDTTANITMTAGTLGVALTKIQRVEIIIRQDDNAIWYPLTYQSDGWWEVNHTAGYLNMIRNASGTFDNATFDVMGGDGNRGWVTVWYEV